MFESEISSEWFTFGSFVKNDTNSNLADASRAIFHALKSSPSIFHWFGTAFYIVLLTILANSLLSAQLSYYFFTSAVPIVKKRWWKLIDWLFPSTMATITINQKSDMHLYLKYWLGKKAKFIASPYDLEADIREPSDSDSDFEDEEEIVYFPLEDEERKFMYKNHIVIIKSGSSDSSGKSGSSSSKSAAEELEALFTKTKTLELSVQGYDNLYVLKEILEEAKDTYNANSDLKTNIFYFKANWNEWVRLKTREQRQLDTVYMDSKMKQDLLKDMGTFFKAKDEYFKRGTPWRRGYLFHGLPGTGKTSLIAALAAHFNLKLAILNVGSLRDDNCLMAIARAPTNALLLLEDIDALFDEKENSKSKNRSMRNKLSFSSFLNAIDGVATPEGRVIIMTTNHIEDLDHALIRPGRIDRKFYFGHATMEQKKEICASFIDDAIFNERFLTFAREINCTTAQLQCVLQKFQNLGTNELHQVTKEEMNNFFQTISSKKAIDEALNDQDEEEFTTLKLVLYPPVESVSDHDEKTRGKLIEIVPRKLPLRVLITAALKEHFDYIVPQEASLVVVSKEHGYEITNVSCLNDKDHCLVEVKPL